MNFRVSTRSEFYQLSFSNCQLYSEKISYFPHIEGLIVWQGCIARIERGKKSDLLVRVYDRGNGRLEVVSCTTTLKRVNKIVIEGVEGYNRVEVFDGSYILITHTKKVTVYTLTGSSSSCMPIVIFKLTPDCVISCISSTHLIWSTELNCMDAYLSIRFSTIDTESSNLYVEWATISLRSLACVEGTTCSTYLGKLYDAFMPSHNADILVEASNRSVQLQQQQQQFQGIFHSGLVGHVQSKQCWAIAYSTISSQYTQSNNISNVHSLRSQLIMVLTVHSQLICLLDGHLQYSKTLPLTLPRHTTQSVNDSVYLHLTASAYAPLLLISSSDRVFVCDALNNGTVLREFIHIGAYICAPLLEGLEEQLLVLPNEQIEAIQLCSIRSGWVSSKFHSHPISDGSSVQNNRENKDNTEIFQDLDVKNWFLYELPYHTNGENKQAVSISCRSMDPHGLWRSDSKFTIDAETYNQAQWRKTPSHHQQQASCTDAQYATNPTTTSMITTKTDTTDSTEEKSTGMTGKVGNRGSIPVPMPIQDLTGGSITEADRTSMIERLSETLQAKEEELTRRTAAIRYKRASLDYLSSLIEQTSAESGVQTINTPLPSNSTSCTNDTTGTTTNPLPFSYRIATPIRRKEKESIYLTELRQAEAEHFQRPLRENIEEEYEDTGLEDNLLPHQLHNIDITVESLYYNMISGTTDIQLFAVVQNTSTQAVYDVELSSYSLKNNLNNDSYSVTKTTRVPYIFPLQRICMSAVVRVRSVQCLVQCSSADAVEFRMILSWSYTDTIEQSTKSSDFHTGAPLPTLQQQLMHEQERYTESDQAELEALKVLHHIIPSKRKAKVFGRVCVSTDEIYYSLHRTVQQQSESPNIMAVRMRRYRDILQYQQRELASLRCFDPEKGLILAKPGYPRFSTSATSSSSSSRPTVAASAAKVIDNTSLPVMYSYLPKMELTLISPLQQQLSSVWPCYSGFFTQETLQSMQQVIATAKDSAFNMSSIVTQLCMSNATNPMSSAIVQVLQLHDQLTLYTSRSNTRLILNHPEINRENTTSTTTSSSSTTSNITFTQDPQNILKEFVHAVQCIGTLSMTSHTIDASIALGNALQYIHQQLPKEVKITLSNPATAKNIHRACICLLQEYALVMEVYEQNSSIHHDINTTNTTATTTTTAATTTNKKSSLKSRLRQARKLSDAAMLELFM